MKNRLLTFVACIALILLIITASIGLPIYFRPFYYMQIQDLNLTEETGYTAEELRASYDQLLDYLTLPGREFGTGVFPYSEEGKAHFEDCKILFDLNGILLLLSATAVLTLHILHRRGLFIPCRPLQKHYSFISGIGTLSLFGLIGALASIDFDRAFVIFHRIFFPGKDNWLFHPAEDPIILALPETFFLRCGILIISSILCISLGLILFAVIRNKAKQSTPVV